MIDVQISATPKDGVNAYDVRTFLLFANEEPSSKKKNAKKKDIHHVDVPEFSAELKEIDVELNGFLSETALLESFEGKPGQKVLLATNGVGGAKRLLLVGAGKKETFTPEHVRRISGTIAASVNTVAGSSVVLELPSSVFSEDVAMEDVAEAFVTGMEGAAYRFLKYKKEDAEKYDRKRVKSVTLLADKKHHTALKRGVKRGHVLAEAVTFVRDKVNEPASEMTPEDMKKAAQQVAKLPGVTLKVHDEASLKKMGAGSHLSVAQGSDAPAYLLHLTYKPTKVKSKEKLVLVGKGITFDSGGYSIKPSQHMENMKDDMAGSATVVATIQAIAELKLPVEVHALAAMAENMVSGGATRPGDVVKAMNGKTIEVLNTDAEGRLVMADALAYAGKYIQPDYIVDVATLTGAAMYCFGEVVAPYMSTDKEFGTRFQKVADTTGEDWLEIPLVPEYASWIKSAVADVKNTTDSPYAGTITAGLFLQHFVPEGVPWIHCDVAGPAFVKSSERPYITSGGTGFGVRTLVQLVESFV